MRMYTGTCEEMKVIDRPLFLVDDPEIAREYANEAGAGHVYEIEISGDVWDLDFDFLAELGVDGSRYNWDACQMLGSPLNGWIRQRLLEAGIKAVAYDGDCTPAGSTHSSVLALDPSICAVKQEIT